MNKPKLSLGPTIQTSFYPQSPDHEAMPMIVNPNDSVIKINPKGPMYPSGTPWLTIANLSSTMMTQVYSFDNHQPKPPKCHQKL